MVRVNNYELITKKIKKEGKVYYNRCIRFNIGNSKNNTNVDIPIKYAFNLSPKQLSFYNDLMGAAATVIQDPEDFVTVLKGGSLNE